MRRDACLQRRWRATKSCVVHEKDVRNGGAMCMLISMPEPTSPPDAILSAVLTTLARATVDARVPVILHSRSLEQARALEHWLTAVHGSRRIVVTAAPRQRRTQTEIEVRLPARMAWPAPSQHLSAMAQHTSLQLAAPFAPGTR
jgi:hypothetical protein